MEIKILKLYTSLLLFLFWYSLILLLSRYYIILIHILTNIQELSMFILRVFQITGEIYVLVITNKYLNRLTYPSNKITEL